MSNIEDFDSNLSNIEKKSYRNVDIYYIEYITMKDFDFVKINSVNPLYIIMDEANGYIEENKWN